ncbi:MAG: hypothetical protein UW92_C0001G0014 [Candidatus Jorgensenbacteria bacterium GW2011_GWA2_45_13]|uniref:Uncharacterized protein n=1 Tax=Candidatus Jorgensenbacteria bacterium GW2011_GWA2_45_13 TaxID=1618662 RepID=A0A0G1L9N3_9BACT|nr:MAG: hypothetical protein UW92_C0001G0014 [Candidatus Jorgensenbacteria bacterium GW2011_GWA2_45_13]HIH18997.1 hypothetical protein [Candidatus Micrarchaeota archaeon]HIH30274.1 hypothetical protein [Candidatus Micrarchaeota archaeon]
MASFIGGFFLAYLLSVSFTDSIQGNLSSISKLVEYSYDLDFQDMIPGVLYNGSIRAAWAVPDSSLAGLEGRSIAVKVTASMENNSSAFFPLAFGGKSNWSESFLRCEVVNGTCANTSVLYAEIPVMVLPTEGMRETPAITLKSEIAEEGFSGEAGTSGLLESLKQIFQPNQSNSSAEEGGWEGAFLNFSENFSEGNFLDTLKPEGDGRDPIEFLRKNTLISIVALVIVVIITGAYLLNSKD